jgi:hypothetical protein
MALRLFSRLEMASCSALKFVSIPGILKPTALLRNVLLRLKGKPNIDARILSCYRPSCIPNGRGRKRPDNGVVVQGGTAPYTYVWKKVRPSAGRPAQRLIKPAQYQVMPGFIPAWLLMPMALLSPLLIAPSPSVNGAPGNRR